MEEVNAGDAEAAQGFFEAAAEISAVGVRAFGGEVEGVGGGGHGAEGLAEDGLALVVAVEGGGVEVVDASAAGGVQDGDAGGVVMGRGQAHAAAANDADSLAGGAVFLVEHGGFRKKDVFRVDDSPVEQV